MNFKTMLCCAAARNGPEAAKWRAAPAAWAASVRARRKIDLASAGATLFLSP